MVNWEIEAKILISNHLLEVTIMEWISVKDRLPEKTGQYLVLLKDKQNRNEIIIDSFEKRWVTEENTEFRYVKVLSKTPMFEPYFFTQATHWMPLPEPPKDEVL